MKLYVKEKTFSMHNKIFVKDENNLDVYEILSNFPSFRDKITINDKSGNRIVYIEQELFHMTPNYNIYINEEFAFKMTREFPLLKNDYLLSNGYKVAGDFRMVNFAIYDNENNQIGSIKRTTGFISIGGSEKYEVDIMDHNKKEIILAILATITNDINRDTNSSS